MATAFAVGRRYRCTREPGSRDLVFDFVIIGPPLGAYSKNYVKSNVRCRLEVVNHGGLRVDPETGRCCDQCTHNREADYSRAHLKKYGVLVES